MDQFKVAFNAQFGVAGADVLSRFRTSGYDFSGEAVYDYRTLERLKREQSQRRTEEKRAEKLQNRLDRKRERAIREKKRWERRMKKMQKMEKEKKYFNKWLASSVNSLKDAL